MSRAELLLEYSSEFSVVYVLLFQLVGLFNIFFGLPAFRPLTILLTAALAISGWWFCRRPSFTWSLSAASAFRLPLLVLSLTYLLFFVDAVTSYPDGYDALSYHLLNPLSWVQTGSVKLTDTYWKMALPSNGELFALPALALKVQQLVFAGNALGTLILAVSVYVLGVKLSGSREGAFFAVLISLSIPMVLFQVFYLNVDTFGTAFLFAGIVFLLRFVNAGKAYSMILTGLVLGISMGTKQIFIVYCGIILVFAIAVLLKKKRAMLIPALLAASALPSTLWVTRNWIATGNPAYPFAIKTPAFSWKGANRFPPFMVKPTVSGPGTSRFRSNPLNEDHGLGPAFVAFAGAGILAAVLECVRKKRLELIAITASVIILGIVWWTSMHVYRFGIPIAVAASILCAILYARLTPVHRVAAQWLLSLALAVGCLLYLAVPGRRVLKRIRLNDWSRSTYYGYPRMLDDLPAGTKILDRSVDARMGFILCGRRLQNQVSHVDGPFTVHNLARTQFDYAVEDGQRNEEDVYFAVKGELVYEGVPPALFPSAERTWRIYRLSSTLH